MPADDDRRFRQFQIRHLLGLLTGAGVLLAIVAPFFRRLDSQTQWLVSLKVLVVAIASLGIMVFLVARRLKLQSQAGPLIERFERRASRILSWLTALGLWLGFLGTAVMRQGALVFIPFPGSPVLLCMAVSYSVIRFWWQIDPTGIEAHERGLVLSGVAFRAWDDISRYSWSGSPRCQLNLFLKERFVLNLKTDAAYVDRLDQILAEHVAR